jgi:hypothetical protein
MLEEALRNSHTHIPQMDANYTDRRVNVQREHHKRVLIARADTTQPTIVTEGVATAQVESSPPAPNNVEQPPITSAQIIDPVPNRKMGHKGGPSNDHQAVRYRLALLFRFDFPLGCSIRTLDNCLL